MAPKIGDISRRDLQGLRGRSKIIWAACPECGIERWKMLNLYRKLNGQILCQSCTGKKAVASGVVRTAAHKPECQCQRCRTTRGELLGNKNPAWGGGRTVRGGYPAILLNSDSPFRAMGDRNGYVLEHRLVVAQALGRSLASYEQVHHINGDKTDNQLSNLELWATSHPSGVRFRDFHCPGCRCFEQKDTDNGEQSNAVQRE